ncbi:hypothetical protein EH165_14485 [Nakamurella antarctica]|uniref:Uncharacterized protein n=1 Tax=Nakamurella antarctica TaxID=1902245 RepID=A0A3G8ZPU6_9ACTN|nr:hypothetical protein [Nakamurella antarctica]AZI59168.1 hypothetical protein EH165_14485 [Nakamurella antarctica]
MDAMTTTFLVVGGLSVVILLISVVIGDVAHFGADADGPFSLPALAGFFGVQDSVARSPPRYSTRCQAWSDCCSASQSLARWLSHWLGRRSSSLRRFLTCAPTPP